MIDEIVLHIQEEFRRRREKNPRYSLRAMAKFLGVAPSVLSRTLSGQTILSGRNRGKVLERLQTPDEV